MPIIANAAMGERSEKVEETLKVKIYDKGAQWAKSIRKGREEGKRDRKKSEPGAVT